MRISFTFVNVVVVAADKAKMCKTVSPIWFVTIAPSGQACKKQPMMGEGRRTYKRSAEESRTYSDAAFEFLQAVLVGEASSFLRTGVLLRNVLASSPSYLDP